MNDFTKQEIEEKVWDIWRQVEEEQGWDYSGPSAVEVFAIYNYVEIILHSMYSTPPLTCYHLKVLADYFETDNINYDRFSEEGRGTCDYGSSYGFTLTIRPNKNKE